MRKSLFIIFLGILGVLHGKNKSQEREAQILIQNSWNVQYSNPKQSAYYAQQAINLIKEDGMKNDTKAEAMLAFSNAQKFLGEVIIAIIISPITPPKFVINFAIGKVKSDIRYLDIKLYPITSLFITSFEKL